MSDRHPRAAASRLALLALFVSAACGHAHDHDHGHDHGDADAHEHEEVALQATAWGERHELFIEHPPVAANVPFVVAAHVTDHLTTQPRTEGELRLELVAPDGSVRTHVEPAPARAGLYLCELTAPTPGVWSMRAVVPANDEAFTVALPDVVVHADSHDAAHVAAPPESDGITFLKEQQWRLGTRIERVTVREVREHRVLPATVHAAPERTARVTAPLAGALLPAPDGPALVIGRRVEAGELLAYVRPPLSDLGVKLLEAEADVERTRIVLEYARTQLDRTALLFEDQARSRRELEDAQFEARSSEAAHAAARSVAEGLRRSGLTLSASDGGSLPVFELRAPIAGHITRITAAIGEHVTSDRAVADLLDASVVHVEVHARPHDLGAFDLSEPPLLRRLRSNDVAQPLELEPLRMLTSVLLADPSTQTLALRYEVQNPSDDGRRLHVGTTLEALLPVNVADAGPAVPLTALVDDAGSPTVFVQLTGEVFEQRHVRLGARDATFVRVTDGLEPGEWVVTHGAYAVRLASASGAVPAHHH